MPDNIRENRDESVGRHGTKPVEGQVGWVGTHGMARIAEIREADDDVRRFNQAGARRKADSLARERVSRAF
jgi:hypothetical protein